MWQARCIGSFGCLPGFALEGRIPATQGKVVWLDFCASWCGVCRTSFPAMDRMQAKYKDKGLVVLGVSVDDDPKKWQAFLEKQNVSFPLVRDAQREHVYFTREGSSGGRGIGGGCCGCN